MVFMKLIQNKSVLRSANFCIFVFVLLISSGCSGKNDVQSCEQLLDIASSREVQEKLISWVDSYSWNTLSDNDFSYGGGVIPGQYRIPDMGFDWSLLKMDKTIGQIRVVTAAALEKGPLLSVSFAEVSRQSVLIRHADSETFGIKDKDHLFMINDRVAIYCAN